MKFWITAIFYLANRLEELADRVSEEIDALSVSLTMETYKLFETVLALEDKKRRLCNFKVLGGLMKEKLSTGEQEVLLRHIRGESFEEIGTALGISKSTAARKFKSAVDTCIAYSESLTYTERRYIDEYKDIPLIWRTVKRMENGKLK